MNSDQGNSQQSARSLFRHVFLLSAGLLVFVFLPADLISRFNSFRFSMSAGDIAVNTAAMSLLLMLSAAIIAFCILLIALPIRLIAGQWIYRWVYRTFNLLALLLPGYYAFFLFKMFFFVFFHLWIQSKWNVIGFIVFETILIAVIVRSKTLPRQLSGFIIAIKTSLLVCAVVAFCVVGWRVVSTDTRLRVSEEQKTRMLLADKRPPNVILVTFDALSAEDMSFYGYRLPTTPNLDAFARGSSAFKNAVAAGTWTKPAVNSLLTGKYPMNHRLISSDFFHTNTNPAPEESLPALLLKSGYYPVALVANWVYAHPYVNGLAPFFEKKPLDYIAWRNLPLPWKVTFLCLSKGLPLAHRFRIESLNWMGQMIVESGVSSFRLPLLKSPLFYTMDPLFPPELTFKDAEKYLSDDCIQADSRPLFLWLHVHAPHDPYLPPLPFKGRFLKGDDLADFSSQQQYLYRPYEVSEQPVMDRMRLRYDENVLYADARFGDFLSFLKSTNRLNDSIVIVTSDHGESFNHGLAPHGSALLYKSVLHIPLIIHMPKQPAGKLISGPVSQVDIAPTILDLLGQPVPSWMDGISRKSSLVGNEIPSKPIFAMDLDGNGTAGKITTGSLAVVEGHYKTICFLDSGAEELYDDNNDPDELKNLDKVLPEKAAHLDKLLRNKFSIPGIFD